MKNLENLSVVILQIMTIHIGIIIVKVQNIFIQKKIKNKIAYQKNIIQRHLNIVAFLMLISRSFDHFSSAIYF